jgi:hypothetical protein
MAKSLSIISGIAALLLFQQHPANGKTWPSSGGFAVSETMDGCELSATFNGRGETQLSVLLGFSEDNYITITNGLWSADEGRVYNDISFGFQGSDFSGGTVLGIKDGFRTGFVAKASSALLLSFSSSPYLHVSKSGEEIDRLSLKGSSRALQTAQACIRDLETRGQKLLRERQRFEDLPDDPFAKK